MNFFRKLFNKPGWQVGLFWSWNVIFLAFMFLGFAPAVLGDMIRAVRGGEIPANFLLFAAILTAVPAIVVGIGATRLRRDPDRLFALGYGIEGPIMLLLALRFFVVRQMTTAVALLLITAALGLFTYLWQLLDKKIDKRPVILTHLRMAGLTLLLITGIYAAVWIGFYALPAGVQGIKSIGDLFTNIWRELTNVDFASIQWRMVPFTILGMILLIFSGTLFVLMPVAVFVLYTKAWASGFKDLTAVSSRIRAIGVSTAVLLTLILLTIPANRQPQHKAFALLNETPTTPAEADALLDQEEAIRDGLLNAFLAPQRYVSAEGEVRHIREIYENTLGLEPANAKQIQTAYETIAKPILYQPVNRVSAYEWDWENQAFTEEPQEAAELYQQYFDEPIVEGERETVVRAARSTWSIDQARANWQAVDDREILLTNQEVTITEHGDWAEFELHEVYENQTWQRQEVVYYFSLPETAVLTGIWLGNSDNRDDRFTYHVAPRGAAQATYRNEVRRNIDPALLEQIGPSQYRLRAFPVEPIRWNWDAETGRSTEYSSPPLHLWVTWQVMADGDNWPLPYLAKKFNVYWTDDTERLLNGEPVNWNE
ncbi:MAG: TIGR02921 family PEP-CTERM protein, partial [Anaerolineales bacterium]|nr:TIGR02921 family PEP-CTERM protein [Anaerolineales bacterium]